MGDCILRYGHPQQHIDATGSEPTTACNRPELPPAAHVHATIVEESLRKAVWEVLACALTILRADAGLGASPVAAKPFDTTVPLRATTIAATLDAPIPTGRNAVWTASFLSARKTLTVA